VHVNGDVAINATTGNKFNLEVVSLTLANQPGDAANFDKQQSYSWKFAEITGNVTGFDPDAFNITLGNFSNDTSGAGPLNWYVTDVPGGGGGHELFLNFAAVPEPSTMALGILVGVGAAAPLARADSEALNRFKL
jgi:hypothetical protein